MALASVLTVQAFHLPSSTRLPALSLLKQQQQTHLVSTPPLRQRTLPALYATEPLQRDPRPVPPDYPRAAARIGITVAATLLTYYAHAQQRCGPVLASSAVTLAGSLVAPGLGQAAMCGSFAGMSSPLLLPSLPWALAAGIATSALFEGLIHYRNAAFGLGGRLGATAFVGVNLVTGARGILGIPSASFSGIPQQLSVSALATSPVLPVTVGFTALGAVATIALREASDANAAADPVRASAVVGLVGALLVGLCGFSELGALATYGGSFVGMSLPSRLMKGIVPGKRPTKWATAIQTTMGKILLSFALAGVLAGLVHGVTLQLGWFTSPAAGWGGKAGMMSFVGCLLYRGVAKAVDRVRPKKVWKKEVW